jgi:response regulator RpfG family c-di-GMP phosphodiesterase
MPGWAVVILAVLGLWFVIRFAVAPVFGRPAARVDDVDEELEGATPRAVPQRVPLLPQAPSSARSTRRRILLVEDDPSLRLVLRATLGTAEGTIEEAGSAEEARELARFWRPSLVILDVGLPGMSGLEFCKDLTEKAIYESPDVILLTGGEVDAAEARAAGAASLLRKPFSPLDLIGTIDRIIEGQPMPPTGPEPVAKDQLLAYARDLSHVVQSERAHRRLLQHAYRQTVTALTDALEARDRVTGHHALRVHRYALELTEAIEPDLLEDPSLEYGFLLHDVGKIGIPDAVLDKPGPLSDDEVRLMRRHPLIGAELLEGVPLLDGEGLQVVRHHHERWDGAGYPNGLQGEEIPLGARIFAVADALDAMTTERPYRRAGSWEDALDEILRSSGSQFDPRVVGALALRERRLQQTQHDLAQIA